MRRPCVFALALLAVILVPTANFSQGGQPSGQMEASRGVAGGHEEPHRSLRGRGRQREGHGG